MPQSHEVGSRIGQSLELNVFPNDSSRRNRLGAALEGISIGYQSDAKDSRGRTKGLDAQFQSHHHPHAASGRSSQILIQACEPHTLQEIQQLRAAEATTHLVIIRKFSRSKTYICSRPTVPCQTSRTYGTKEGYWMIQRRSTIWTRHPLQRLHWQKQELLRTQQFGSWRKRTMSPTKSADRSLAG